MLIRRNAAVPPIALLSVALLSCFAHEACAQIPDVPGWQLFWHDEFDGTTLNTTNWTALDRQDSFNNEKQYYWHDQVKVSGGNLQITAINTPRANKLYQSGLITSNALYGQGRFEARIDLPTTQGMWPAFWMNPNQVQWPLGGEIDIMENKGSEPTVVSSAFHWQKDPGQCCGQHRSVAHRYSTTSGGQPVNFTTGFHTYAAEWDSKGIRFFLDGTLVFNANKDTVENTKGAWIYDHPFYIILNLAIGGDWPGAVDATTPFPSQMLVDYVRVYQ
jgi:beta-glucanase (GH16 family)